MSTTNHLPTYDQLVGALKALLPLATSRAEDLHETGGENCPHWQAADKAVEDADALLEALQTPN